MKPIKLPDIYFDLKGAYWMRLSDSRFLPCGERDVKRHMMKRGYYIDTEINDQGLKAGDNELIQAQTERYCDYAGALAGHKCGFYTGTDGKRILVTEQAKAVEPKKGSIDWLDRFFTSLFETDQQQCLYFFLWLKFAHESLERGDFMPGQFVVLAGPSGCGKSLCQAIVTAFLGGRSANPWRYMTGKTDFNADLAQAEHLAIEDQNSGLDIRARRHLGESIKQITVVENWSVHEKGRKALQMRFFRRGSMSVNDEPEKIGNLPPIDADLKDKISLLKCSPARLDDRTKNWDAIQRELPALAWHVRKLRVPKAWLDSRYGVAAYHNREIWDMLNALSPEMRLLELIDQTLDEEWKGSASELETKFNNSPQASSARLLLSFSSACGTYLQRLALKLPGRVSYCKNRGKTVWTIKE